jgi:hypothetical protein
MYNFDINIEYFENNSYRQCLREVMNMDVSQMTFEQYKDELDDETKDELLIDEKQMSAAMDDIYEKTKKLESFQSLYSSAAALMFSTDPNIGLAVLFSYDYFSVFHMCIQAFHKNDLESMNTKIEQLHSLLRK